MVELLDKVLGRLCEGTTMENFLTERFGTSDESGLRRPGNG
jgi:hypothetical protein